MAKLDYTALPSTCGGRWHPCNDIRSTWSDGAARAAAASQADAGDDKPRGNGSAPQADSCDHNCFSRREPGNDVGGGVWKRHGVVWVAKTIRCQLKPWPLGIRVARPSRSVGKQGMQFYHPMPVSRFAPASWQKIAVRETIRPGVVSPKRKDCQRLCGYSAAEPDFQPLGAMLPSPYR